MSTSSMNDLRRLAIEGGQYETCSTTGIEFVEIPAGPFFAGRFAGKKIETPTFKLARHPVTNRQWHDFARQTDYKPADESGFDSSVYLKHWQSSSDPPAELLDHPVTWISYIDALNYLAWAKLSLPVEWHWEKASRGLDGRQCPWGDEISLAFDLAHVGKKRTAAVSDYPDVRTAFGCEQTIGNVSEFCLRMDNFTQDLPMQPCPNSVDVDELIALRGSCFLRKSIRSMTCSYRRRLSAGTRNSWTGLRVASYES